MSPDGDGGVGIIGGGLLGLTIAHRLAAAGVEVTVHEAGRRLGGLAGSARVGDHRVDRYYHVILPTDAAVVGLVHELGLGDRLRFSPTRVGTYHEGRLGSISSARELLAFRGLPVADRLRLGAFAARCQLIGDHERLEDVPLGTWLRATCGDRLWERFWRPLLDAKFDGQHADLPATYLWARTRRMARTRDAASGEVMGRLGGGGYQLLADALGDAIRAAGGTVLTGAPVERVVGEGGRICGVVRDGRLHRHALTVATLLRPTLDGLLEGEAVRRLGPDACRYLGVTCVVARLMHPVSPYYALNITDRRVPLTTVVEATHVVEPAEAGGSLVYLPRYVVPESPQLERDADDLRDAHLGHLRTIFGAPAPADVLATAVARTARAEPVHVLGGSRGARRHAVPGLVVCSSADVYPRLVNGEAILTLAEEVAAEVAEHVHASRARLPVAA